MSNRENIPVYVDRHDTDCKKWDGIIDKYDDNDLLPLWIADMDFQIPECVQNALEKYIKTGIIGYYSIPDSYYQSFINWEKNVHQVYVNRETIRFSPGAVAGINWLLLLKTQMNDAVIVLSPVYYPFFEAIENNGRRLIEFDLTNNKGYYTIDFEAFEKNIVEKNVKCMLFCSPHNPVGRVWTEEELSKLMEICMAYGVFVISDEIHQDFTYGRNHFSLLRLNASHNYDRYLAVITAPSKTFNLAGAQNSFVIILDDTLRSAWDTYVASIRVVCGNSFGYVAAQAAYEGGANWLECVKQTIYTNYLYAKETLTKAYPNIVVSPLEGTYLMWIDIGAYVKAEDMTELIQSKCRLAVDYGDWFRGKGTQTCIRINMATSNENVVEAIDRIIKNLK